MIRKSSSAIRILVAWAALEAARIITSYAFPFGKSNSGQHLFWLALVDLLAVATLGLLAMKSDWKGWRLGLAVSIIPFAIDLVNFIEGVVFLGGLDFRSMYQSGLAYALMIPVLGRPFWIRLHRYFWSFQRVDEPNVTSCLLPVDDFG